MRPPHPLLRRWLVGIAIACIALELVYVVAAFLMLRGDTLSRLINKKPEKFRIEFTGARSYFPGVVAVDQLTLRGQSRKGQWYLAADQVRGRLSLWRLALKTVHVRSASTSGLLFRLRPRLDPPPVKDETGAEVVKEVRGSQHFPEIPGFTNPPNPRPEDLYPVKKKPARPWVIDLGGVEVEGPVEVAVNRMRIEGEGVVSGAMVYRTGESIEVRRGNLRWASARLLIDSESAIEDLALDVTSRWKPFPAKGAKLAQILGGITGSVAIAGTTHTKASVPVELVPGLPISATGRFDTTLRLVDGALQPGSSYSSRSESLRIGLLGLTAAGSATIVGATRAAEGRPLTELKVDLDSFSLFDPDDATVGVQGSGLAVHATWDGLSLADFKPATSVEIVLPPTEISDVGVIGTLLPPPWGLDLASGTGTVSARLAVDADRQASGRLDLESRQLRVKTRGTPIRADLGIHAALARGDLKQRRFEVPEATVTIENVVNETPRKKKKDRGPWWCSLNLEQATVALGSPLAAQGSITVKMRDTRPIMALIEEFSDPPGWFALVPEVENIDGSLLFAMDGAATTVRDMRITGESLEILGWLRLAHKLATGRIFAKYGILAAGIGLDTGDSSVHIVRPRRWFDSQPTAPSAP
jgi:hypothetical protein